MGSTGTLLLVLAGTLITFFWLDRYNNWHRSLVSILVAAVAIRYLSWRLTETVIPYIQSDADIYTTIWVSVVYGVELLAFFEIALFLLIMSRYNDRHLTHYPLTRYPTVDILIPTYNEPMDVLEKTIYGAMGIDYPSFKVWVLDDGDRDWLKQFCKDNSVGYITRSEHDYAKAGNINHALSIVDSELFAIFDADFVPGKNFLNRTVPYFLHDHDIGIVQTPQYFFNKDPVQSNLGLHDDIPDEQRLFFSEMAPARDAWNAAFCCGSCSILRRSAVDESGGIPTQSITEDLLSTLVLLKHGYRTIYHNEKLSQGLAAESTNGYFVQRIRWCQGGIQCMLVEQGPLRAPGLSLLQRILFLPYGWIIQPITRVFLVLIPLVYLWYGLAPLHYTTDVHIISYFAPPLVAYVAANVWFTNQKYYPILNTAIGLFSAFRMLPAVISSLIKPFGKPFKVTPKGLSNNTVHVETYTLVVALVLFVSTVFGLVINTMPDWAIIHDVDFFPYAVFWATLNLFYLLIVMLLCFDFPRHRAEERFKVSETVLVNHQPIESIDMSVTGIRTHLLESVERGDTVSVTIYNGDCHIELAGIVRNSGSFTAIEYVNVTDSQKRTLVQKIFSGQYENTVEKYHNTLLIRLWKRIVGKQKA